VAWGRDIRSWRILLAVADPVPGKKNPNIFRGPRWQIRGTSREYSARTYAPSDPPNASVSAGRRSLPCCVPRTYTFYFRTTVSTRQQMAARTDASCAYASPLCRLVARYRDTVRRKDGRTNDGEPRRRGSARGDARCRGRGRDRRRRHRHRSLARSIAPPRQRCVDVKAYARVHASRVSRCIALSPCIATREPPLGGWCGRSWKINRNLCHRSHHAWRGTLGRAASRFPASKSFESCQSTSERASEQGSLETSEKIDVFLFLCVYVRCVRACMCVLSLSVSLTPSSRASPRSDYFSRRSYTSSLLPAK